MPGKMNLYAVDYSYGNPLQARPQAWPINAPTVFKTKQSAMMGTHQHLAAIGAKMPRGEVQPN